MSPIPAMSSAPITCGVWIPEAGGICGNKCASVTCTKCAHTIALCGECGGVEEAGRQLRAHESTHELDAGAKHATCRWCDWTSADAYHADDEYAKERAFQQQRSHVKFKHPGVFKKIAAHVAQSRAR